MVDEELVLRFFALRDQLPTYRPPLKRFLNNYMRGVQNPPSSALSRFGATFRETIGRVSMVLGSSAFRVTDRRGGPVDPAVNRALFDAQISRDEHRREDRSV